MLLNKFLDKYGGGVEWLRRKGSGMKKALVFSLAILFLIAGCELEEDCPVNCTTKVTDPQGHVIECHCPN